MIPSQSILHYDPTTPKLFVDVDPDIVGLARALLPQPLKSTIRKQKYPPHISVVRNEPFVHMQLDGIPVAFAYDPEPVVDNTYAWLRVASPQLTNIRTSLGLSPSSEWSRPPSGEDVFHITIGNWKPA